MFRNHLLQLSFGFRSCGSFEVGKRCLHKQNNKKKTEIGLLVVNHCASFAIYSPLLSCEYFELKTCTILRLALNYDVKVSGRVSASVCLNHSHVWVIDWVKEWKPPPRWSPWALSHCAMTTAAAVPDPHHHIIDTKPTANLPLARCLWHGSLRGCLNYNSAP